MEVSLSFLYQISLYRLMWCFFCAKRKAKSIISYMYYSEMFNAFYKIKTMFAYTGISQLSSLYFVCKKMKEIEFFEWISPLRDVISNNFRDQFIESIEKSSYFADIVKDYTMRVEKINNMNANKIVFTGRNGNSHIDFTRYASFTLLDYATSMHHLPSKRSKLRIFITSALGMIGACIFALVFCVLLQSTFFMVYGSSELEYKVMLLVFVAFLLFNIFFVYW